MAWVTWPTHQVYELKREARNEVPADQSQLRIILFYVIGHTDIKETRLLFSRFRKINKQDARCRRRDWALVHPKMRKLQWFQMGFCMNIIFIGVLCCMEGLLTAVVVLFLLSGFVSCHKSNFSNLHQKYQNRLPFVSYVLIKTILPYIGVNCQIIIGKSTFFAPAAI